ncbi:hypothetical protein J2736_003028 [Paenibacillus qinlingensis]|uniref:Uncharacterized protein n=1 Tax=Paenibacillus qinlingensis TaxID=1837343 RepID=A0ABU1NX18_9BACL|nr:hypothetical protein [Paenibacillus qinlingensis]
MLNMQKSELHSIFEVMLTVVIVLSQSLKIGKLHFISSSA